LYYKSAVAARADVRNEPAFIAGQPSSADRESTGHIASAGPKDGWHGNRVLQRLC